MELHLLKVLFWTNLVSTKVQLALLWCRFNANFSWVCTFSFLDIPFIQKKGNYYERKFFYIS
jgi:hypothetical protein